MLDILTLIPGRKKQTSSGWYSFNAICCGHFGHRTDKRMRGGIKFDGHSNWTYHCFNCGFKCNFTLGRAVNKNTKSLLQWCGLDESQIGKITIESLKYKDLVETVLDQISYTTKLNINFDEYSLPPNSVVIDNKNPKHSKFIDYLSKRKIDYTTYPFLVTPEDEGRNSNRIIIPYTYRNKIVGYTSRYLDDKTPKYINEQQPGYVFGYDFQKKDWESCILVEGIFDALSINGCAYLHNDISEKQINLLSNLHRRIILVPDQDKTGLEICEKALSYGYHVSIPEWDDDVKDVNDAVVKYGKIATLLSILESSTTSKIKIEMRKKKIAKRL